MSTETEYPEIYRNPDRKREIWVMLEKLSGEFTHSARLMELKALWLLSLSVLFVLSVSIVLLVSGIRRFDIRIGYAVGYVTFVIQLFYFLRVIVPKDRAVIPSTERGLSYESILDKYILLNGKNAGLDEDRYLDQIIADYAGLEDTQFGSVIEVNKSKNYKMSKHFNRALVAMFIVYLWFGLLMVAALF